MERMYFARWRRLLLMLGALVVALFCTASLVSSENPVTFANKTYRTLGDFQKSEVFRELGSRCGTPPPSRYEFVSALRALSDCNESQSANLSEYPPTTVYTIPVWVHIIMDNSCSDGAISDELVASQIEILNEDFRALAGTPGENGADVMVQFCLAGVDRTCDDVYFNECYYNNCNSLDGQNQNETYKNDLNVDPVHNLNIYTKQWPDKSGLLGYATWPWEDAGQPRDGVAINWQNFGRDSSSGPPYDQGRTTTHEIGHYLGLLHTFQSWCTAGNVGLWCSADWHCDTSSGAGDGVCEQCGDDTDPGCYSKPGGDFICDTNPEEDPNFGCDVTAATCSSPDPIHNYMDYTDDTCMEEFTSEQAQRTVCTILNYRADLPGQCGPTADADGPYLAECQGATSQVPLDGSGSSDRDGDPLTYAWSTDCPGGSFDDATSVTPVLTLDTSPGCLVTCNVSLTVDDGAGGTDTATSSVTISDSQTPVLTCPADVTIECDEATDPSNTGSATATDQCDPDPDVIFSDVVVPGTCPQEFTFTRTWTATDACGKTSSCVQTVQVVDTTPPVIDSNAPATITPPDAPISFTATATDNCDGDPSVEITGYDCYFFTKKGKRVDKTESCVVEISRDTITILDSGGVDDQIEWTISAGDNCGNAAEATHTVSVVNPGNP